MPGAVAYYGLLSKYITTICTFLNICPLTFTFVVTKTIFSFFSKLSTHTLGIDSPVNGRLSSLTSIVAFNFTPTAVIFD